MRKCNEASILIVDDQEANVDLLEMILEDADYSRCVSVTDPRQVLEAYHSHKPDLILLDLHMPHMDGFAVMKQLREHVPASTYLPILVLTADISTEVKQRALASGARDFLTKPLDDVEVLLRINNLLETRMLHLDLQAANGSLEEKVRARTQDLETARNEVMQKNLELQASQIETLERLALAAECRDDNTGQHTQRVGHTVAMLAGALGLNATEAFLLQRSAPLHDVGKIGVSDSILLKPERLSTEEFDTMKQHTLIGARMLSGSRSRLLQQAEAIALSHHEHWDGNGYPHGLTGDGIPLEARIVAVADVFDALTHARPYKTAWPLEAAVSEIRAQSARQFDPQIVEAFLTLPHSELI
jgi:putative two-component system response regulator